MPASLSIPLAIRTSSAAEIDRLLVELASSRSSRREAAIARLTVIGARAVQRIGVLAMDPAASADARVAAFRALEAIADHRALEPTLRAVFDTDESVAVAAIGAARVFLKARRGDAIIDRLTEIAADRHLAVRRRLAAIDALRSLEPSTLEPLVAALQSDPHVEIARLAEVEAGVESGAVYVTNAAEGRTELEAIRLRRALGRLPAGFALPTLRRLIERMRAREGSEPPPTRAEWTAARAAAHVALARQGSRLALYDLRETLESADASLPVAFLTALAGIGDRSCLAPIASAYARTQGEARDWWHRHLVEAFRGIVSRERMTKRHSTAKQIKSRWPAAFAALWP